METANFRRVAFDCPLAAWARCAPALVDGADSVNAAYQSNYIGPDTFSVRFSLPLVMHRKRAEKREWCGMVRATRKRNAGADVRDRAVTEERGARGARDGSVGENPDGGCVRETTDKSGARRERCGRFWRCSSRRCRYFPDQRRLHFAREPVDDRARFNTGSIERRAHDPLGSCLLPRRAVNLGHRNNGSPRMEAPIIDDELWILIDHSGKKSTRLVRIASCRAARRIGRNPPAQRIPAHSRLPAAISLRGEPSSQRSLRCRSRCDD